MYQQKSSRLLATVVAGALALATVTSAVAAPALAVAETRSPHTGSLQKQLDRLTHADGLPGALAHVRYPDGRTVTLVSGTARRGSGREMVGPDARFRIGSLTKPILATTVMRLVERDKIDLNAYVDRYLPGVLRGEGPGEAIDGRKITIRDLLQQTSGLPEYVDAVDWSKLPQDYLKLALNRKPTPIGHFAYANTNYLVLGMIVKAVTGHDFREVSRDLVLKPLGMRDTYWPAKGETGVRGPHAHTYGVHPANPKAGVVDLTRLPGYEFGASGGLVSTPEDLNRFWRGVFTAGPPSRDSFRAMIGHLVPITSPGWPSEAKYGFGIARARLSCGLAWFHGGDVPGVSAISGRVRTGRQATVYTTGSTDTAKQRADLIATFETALCK
ncbi:serine hydrolase domain-containing protein [Sphaerisporangium corydalis]|uniref:Serine hydrolase domain-containing protein n=1 Tax=Sphaerisporangium corydalis TaxID=1441875 RepID=A0ABV9E9V4_9ACTN|nr:serine hydrolase domain-containing protein [Sphaerisporangium corydalis]